jgi:FkbM family methyltransferase
MKFLKFALGLSALSCLFMNTSESLSKEGQTSYEHSQSLKHLYHGLTDSFIACKRLADISAQNNRIVILDIGSAISDFLIIFNRINNNFPVKLECLAIGVDPLINQYKERVEPSRFYGYKNLYDAAICETSGTVDIHVNNILLDLSSVKKIDLNVVNALPSEYDVVKRACIDKNMYTITRRSMTIDDLCRLENIERVDILKLDTQGNEYEILNSISKELLKNIAIIYVETSVPNKKCLYKNQASFEIISQFMVENNFKLTGAYGLDDAITLENSIDINCIFINAAIFGL